LVKNNTLHTHPKCDRICEKVHYCAKVAMEYKGLSVSAEKANY